jgi:cytoplasmic iron level regulating protein YaaA (DUF328/UPF0246 family)
MLILISPAKKLNFSPHSCKEFSIPEFASDTQLLINDLQKLSADEIARLMRVSNDIAELNFERFQNFSDEYNFENAKQAIFAFNGEVYNGLKAGSFTKDQLSFADQHLRILSGLYGVLKPLDLMQPYRLEMGSKFVNVRGRNLYEFWRAQVTEKLNQTLAKQKTDIIINLASEEYFKVIDKSKLQAKIITPSFKHNKQGVYKVIMMYAKKARGNMARFIIENKITDPQDLKNFSEGYRFEEFLSDEDIGDFGFVGV